MSSLKLEGELSLDGSGWERGLRTAGNQASHFAKEGLGEIKSAIAGAFTFGAVAELTRHIIEHATQIKDAGEQYSITTDEVQRLEYATNRVGLSFEDAGHALSKMGVARKEAAEGNVELRDTFLRYGVTLQDLQNPSLRNIDLMTKMAEAISGMTLNARNAAELRELFGRGGDRLAQVMKEFNESSGIVLIENEQIEKIDRAEKAVKELWRSVEAVAAGPIAAGAGVLDGKSLGERVNSFLELDKYARGFIPGAGILGGILKPNKGPASAFNPTARDTGQQFGPNPQEAPLFQDKAAQKEALNLAQQQEELGKLQYKNAFDLLTADQKRVELQKEIKQLAIDAEALRPSSEVLANGLMIEREKKIGELRGLGTTPINVNSFHGIGNALGHTAREIPAIQEKLIEANNRTTAALHRVATALENKNTSGTPFQLP